MNRTKDRPCATGVSGPHQKRRAHDITIGLDCICPQSMPETGKS